MRQHEGERENRVRGVAYLRVSGQSQADDGFGLDVKLDRVRDFARRERIKLVGTPYVDAGVSYVGP